MREQLDTASGEKQAKVCVENLCTNLSQFDSKKTALPFSYPFTTTHTFRSQCLTIEDGSAARTRTGTESVIKAHHLNVRFEGLSQFDKNLSANLRAYIDSIATPDSLDWEELNELLDEISNPESKKSNLTELRRIVDTESLARLLRDVKIDYLEYLKTECAKTNLSNTNSQGFNYLDFLIVRLKMFLDYIKTPSLADPHYEVTYLKESVNLRTAFSQANALDMLPIITEYEGVIGESTDKDNDIKEFNMGLRLKLNGAVNAYNEESTLDYYMTELDPNSQRHKDQLNNSSKAKNLKIKILKIACLYYFIFAVDETGKITDKYYNPISKIETDILKKLKADDNTDAQVKEVLCNIKSLILNKWQVSANLDALKRLLQNFLNQRAILPPSSKTAQLCINKKILKDKPAKILNSGNFFVLELHKEDQSRAKAEAREALAYIDVMSPPVNLQSLTSLAVTFTFDDVRYFIKGETQEFSMTHDISDIKAMPVVFSVIGRSEKEQKPITHAIYNQYFANQKIVFIGYKYR